MTPVTAALAAPSSYDMAPGVALRQGVAAAQARDYDRARGLLQQATAESPDDLIAWYWLAIASPSADAAIPCLRRVLELDAAHPRARESLSQLLVTKARQLATAGQSSDARSLVTEATRLTPDSQAPWLALAALATNHVERIDALRRLVDITPDDARLRTQLRQALLARGVMTASSDRAEARERFREAASLNPLDARVWRALSTLAESRGERMRALRELIRVAPDHLQGRLDLRKALAEEAVEHSSAGRTADSYAYWQEAITINGGDVESWLGVAATTSDEQEAAKAIETAYELDPLDPRAVVAMDRLRGPQFDPASVSAPDDAFARFEPAGGAGAPFDLPADPIDPGDSLLDAFANLAEASTAAAVVSPATVEPPVAAAEPSAAAAVAPPISAEPAASSQRTVMVVDDSPTIRKILGLTLERAGYAVVAEADGESALATLANVVPDVVLLDISMPKLDGYEVCKRIKEDQRTAKVPVIMLSGKDAFFDKVKGHMAGATEYLTKPFETDAVLACVDTHSRIAAESLHG